MNVATKFSAICAAASLFAAAFSVQAAEVFAEPSAAKSGRSAYAITAFSDGKDDAISFTMQLPKGLKDVDTRACGGSPAGAAAKCLYEPTTGKLAVVVFRLDGKPLAKGELSLGRVEYRGQANEKIAPTQLSAVTSARRGPVAAARDVRRANSAER